MDQTDGVKATTHGDGFLNRTTNIRLDAYLDLLAVAELMDIMLELGVADTELYPQALQIRKEEQDGSE